MTLALGCEPTLGYTDPPPDIIHPGPTGDVVGKSYFGRNGYVEYIAGDLPVIIVAPHGGSIRAGDMPNRANPDTLRDSNTEELARAIDTAFVALTGHHPHIVICRVHRVKVDCNRTQSVGAGSDPEAVQAWGEFQAYIARAKEAIAASAGRGLLIDLHGHGHAIQRLELGYLLSANELGLSDATLDGGAWRDSTSVRELLVRTGRSLTALLRGPQSLGTLLAAAGYPSVPSATDPAPGTAPYFNGGYNTAAHGSLNTGSISAIQIESHFSGVRDSAPSRAAFAAALATAINAFRAAWF